MGLKSVAQLRPTHIIEPNRASRSCVVNNRLTENYQIGQPFLSLPLLSARRNFHFHGYPELQCRQVQDPIATISQTQPEFSLFCKTHECSLAKATQKALAAEVPLGFRLGELGPDTERCWDWGGGGGGWGRTGEGGGLRWSYVGIELSRPWDRSREHNGVGARLLLEAHLGHQGEEGVGARGVWRLALASVHKVLPEQRYQQHHLEGCYWVDQWGSGLAFAWKCSLLQVYTTGKIMLNPIIVLRFFFSIALHDLQRKTICSSRLQYWVYYLMPGREDNGAMRGCDWWSNWWPCQLCMQKNSLIFSLSLYNKCKVHSLIKSLNDLLFFPNAQVSCSFEYCKSARMPTHQFGVNICTIHMLCSTPDSHSTLINQSCSPVD